MQNVQVSPLIEVTESEVEIETSDGWRLSALCREPPGALKGAVLLGHAMMANRRSLDRPAGRGLASTLNQAGLATVALDVRGHGRSGCGPAEGGNWSYDDIVLRDLPAALDFLRQRYPEQPRALLGHSLTAHGTVALLGQQPQMASHLDALVLMAANVWVPELEPSAARRLRKWFSLLGFKVLTWPFGYFPTRRLKMGSDDVSQRFVEMFQVARRTGHWQSEAGRDYLSGLDAFGLPVLGVVGRGDTLLCHPECSLRFHKLLGGCRVWHWTVGRKTGLSFDPDHMQIVTDQRSAPLWSAIGDWLLTRFQQRGQPIQPELTETS